MTSAPTRGSSRLVVVGVSLGGLNALRTFLSGLPERFPWPVAIAQHRSRDSDDSLCQLLQQASALPVSEVWDKQPFTPGHIYLAPADYHVLIEPSCFSLSQDPLVNFSRPSIDLLFESAADALTSGVVGVVLTGANHDGARGAAHIKAREGRVIVQDPATAESVAMPQAALDAAAVDAVLPLDGIAGWLVQQTNPRAGATL